ncbi:DNA-3-methyladenine glycosylase [Arthrobacter sulfonylureivorans]|uniref:Putative 3-methyladenine DNA glycosylase n=1 Tax=Arthrobacter sulfonylureivorans TaxID=2486855 RepID=A0ABY3W8U9_9MICC|nr:DNA-3-methyladenine glycosylase [Arthrobacter sulfonylureivorans]UNK44747.1 DNA-3-methyladenine glycosylase [Arthrobacter sulfonylureivorans]
MDAALLRWLGRPAVEVAPGLLGARLAHTTAEGTVAVRLTEVEAYMGEHDPGSHAFRGLTNRNKVMFGPPGHIYVYFTYGMHHCVNIVCGHEGQATGALLRAGEVTEGLDLARSRRTSAKRDAELARGPARLAVALGLGLVDNGRAVAAGGLALTRPAVQASHQHVRNGPRVGVSGEGGTDAYPWRFWLEGDPTVSPYRAAKPRRRAGSG